MDKFNSAGLDPIDDGRDLLSLFVRCGGGGGGGGSGDKAGGGDDKAGGGGSTTTGGVLSKVTTFLRAVPLVLSPPVEETLDILRGSGGDGYGENEEVTEEFDSSGNAIFTWLLFFIKAAF